MSKLLLWIIFGVVIYALWRNSRRRQAARPESTEQAMLRCDRCATYFPGNEAVRDGDGRVFCCREHRDQGRAA